MPVSRGYIASWRPKYSETKRGRNESIRGARRNDQEIGSLCGVSNGAGRGLIDVLTTLDEEGTVGTSSHALKNVWWKEVPVGPSPII